MDERSPLEIQIPGHAVILSDAPEAEEVQQILRLLTRAFGEASTALVLFEKAKGASGARAADSDWDRDRALERAIRSNLEPTPPVDPDHAAEHRNANKLEVQRRLVRTKLANGILPQSLQHHIPFLYAKAFLNAADAIGRMLEEVAKYSSVPIEAKDAPSRYYSSFPDLREVRNTTQHLEDRGRGFGRRGKKLTPVQAVSGPALIGGLAIDFLIQDRFGSTMADGKYGEVEVSRKSLATMRTHFLFEGDFRDSDQLFCGDRASLKKRDRIPGSGNANAFLRNCWPPSPWTVVKARSHDGSAAWP